MPLIMRWPGVLPARKVSNQVAITMDLTATILGATGTEVPSTHKLDGIDLMPSLTGRSPTVSRELFWRRPHPFLQRAVRSGNWKLLWEGGQFYLFDLANDQIERNDLTAVHPEVVRQLKMAIEAWEKDVDAPNPEVPAKSGA